LRKAADAILSGDKPPIRKFIPGERDPFHGRRLTRATQRYAHLARDAVASVKDELGAAMQAAITKKTPPDAKVVKLRRPRR
jgi:hypothetical protein